MTDAQRLLPLEGGRNFRDLGGYRTEDGRTVKWRKLFRSGTMHKLTEKDHDYLSQIGLRLICDLRTKEERAAEPTKWPAADTENLSFDHKLDDSMGGLRQHFSKERLKPEDTANVMMEMYASISYDHASQYRALFGRLANGQVPLAFHCSAGKDRAGTAAALILTALGIPRETVVQDYALSEKLVDFAKEFASRKDQRKDTPYAFIAGVSLDLIAPMMRSDPRYIETAFAQIDKDHGSVLAFIQTELGVNDAKLASIRDNLLE